METASDSRTLLHISRHCYKFRYIVWNSGTILQVSGQCLQFRDNVSNSWALPQIPRYCFIFQDNVSHFETLLKIPRCFQITGHCLKFMDTLSNSGTLLEIAGHGLKSNQICFLFISFCIYYTLNVYLLFTCCSLQPRHYSSLTSPSLQHTANQERNDQCGNQHHSRELPMMGIVMPEICWVYKKYNKIINSI